MTFLSVEEITKLEESLKNEPHKRLAQKALAQEVVRDLHGQEELDSALKITDALFRGNLQNLEAKERLSAVKNMDKNKICHINYLACINCNGGNIYWKNIYYMTNF